MKIIALTDYKNRFGSKHFDVPYRSGMDKLMLEKYFRVNGFTIEFTSFSQICNSDSNVDKSSYYIYTSSEDMNYFYKSYIEDVILYLQQIGCKIIPSYNYLRANNNKVFMELLLKLSYKIPFILPSYIFGTKEEMLNELVSLKFPVVVKASEGASGRRVYKAENFKQLKKVASKVATTRNWKHDFKEIVRSYIHKGYVKESKHRRKFVVQQMIPRLANDWKVYYFYDKIFIFYRPVFGKRGFRASGGGYKNYSYGNEAPLPEGFFQVLENIISTFDIPHASLDIGFDGENFYLFEIQFLYFGTAGIPYSKGYYKKFDNNYSFVFEKLSIEQVYVDAISGYIKSGLVSCKRTH